jgi:uncharacterized lipoprotein YajG
VKCQRRTRGLWILAFPFLLIACFDEKSYIAVPSTVSLSYTPETKVEPVKAPGTVAVVVNDLRANQSKVGNTAGLVLASGKGVITTSGNVAEVLKFAIVSELRDRGFTVGSGPASVSIDVTQFDVEHVVQAMSGVLEMSSGYNSAAEVLIHVEVTGVGKRRLYSRLVFGQHSSENGSDQQTLDLAFEMAVQNLFADPKFTSAILSAESGQPSSH